MKYQYILYNLDHRAKVSNIFIRTMYILLGLFCLVSILLMVDWKFVASFYNSLLLILYFLSGCLFLNILITLIFIRPRKQKIIVTPEQITFSLLRSKLLGDIPEKIIKREEIETLTFRLEKRGALWLGRNHSILDLFLILEKTNQEYERYVFPQKDAERFVSDLRLLGYTVKETFQKDKKLLKIYAIITIVGAVLLSIVMIDKFISQF